MYNNQLYVQVHTCMYIHNVHTRTIDILHIPDIPTNW